MNGMQNPYVMNPFMQNNPMTPPNQMNVVTELEQRISRLERQVKRLENKILKEGSKEQEDYSTSPPKDSGMYMM